MDIHYSTDVSKCCYTIKCIPKNNDRQKVSNIKIDMIPESKPEWASDSHGNRYIFGYNEIPHSYFKFHISGDAECGITPYESIAGVNDEMIYRHSHGLTVPGDNIIQFFETIRASYDAFDEMSAIKKAQAIMEKIHSYLIYEKGCTCVCTSAEEALILGRGVCQDYSHIMISLLNLAGCSARYVTGLIIGEGESHAWVEVINEGKWFGFDPTNNCIVLDSHIKLGCGRDATECQINRGIMHGGGDQTQAVFVSVEEISPEKSIISSGVLF